MGDEISFDDFIYLIKHRVFWDGNDEKEQRKHIVIPCLLPELYSIVMEFFPKTIRWQWTDSFHLQLSRHVSVHNHILVYIKIESQCFICGIKRCKYCGACKKCDKRCDKQNHLHQLGKFIYRNRSSEMIHNMYKGITCPFRKGLNLFFNNSNQIELRGTQL